MRFRTLRGRILFLICSLLLAISALTFLLLDRVQFDAARRGIETELAVGSRVIERLLAERSAALVQGASALSHDFAFLKAYEAGDRETVRSGLVSLRDRIGADVIRLQGIEAGYPLFVDASGSEPPGRPFPHPDLVTSVEETGEPSTALVELASGLHRVVVVPLLAPEPAAWFCVGFRVGDTLAASFATTLGSHVSFISAGAGPARVFASTRPVAERSTLVDALARTPSGTDETLLLEAPGDRHVAIRFTVDAAHGIAVVLERSLEAALAPYRRLRHLLLAVTLAGLALALAGGNLVAGTVSRPVRDLAAATRRVEAGDFTGEIPVRQSDEIGELERAFNGMVHGLAERDRVRDLLGKVVSPQIAEELLRNATVSLGGEEREATILFADIRSFTTICENRAPAEVLAFLNAYLTRMSRVIESHGGVIDKYVGDAIMALFGAPVAQPDHAARALDSALGMLAALAALRGEFAARGWPLIEIGVGVNTGTVVAGNMGSLDRLNYTVLGDAVNLASRLESQTKAAGCPIVISESTRLRAGEGFLADPLGEVTVKGKKEPTRIYALRGRRAAADPADGKRGDRDA